MFAQPVITSVRQEEGSESCDPLPSTATVGNSPGRGPPRPPGQHGKPQNRETSDSAVSLLLADEVARASADRTGGPTPTDSSLRAFPATEEVVTIDLARISPHTLPPSIKLKGTATPHLLNPRSSL